MKTYKRNYLRPQIRGERDIEKDVMQENCSVKAMPRSIARNILQFAQKSNATNCNHITTNYIRVSFSIALVLLNHLIII